MRSIKRNEFYMRRWSRCWWNGHSFAASGETSCL